MIVSTASMASALAIQASCQIASVEKHLNNNELERGRARSADPGPHPKFAIAQLLCGAQ
jgi:hypothetical protein